MKLDGIGSFNLLTGANDVGKTSVLEALLLLSGLSDYQLPITIQKSRGLDAISFDTMEGLFHNLDTGSPISLSGSLRNSHVTFRLEISTGASERSLTERSEQSSIGRRVSGVGVAGSSMSEPISNSASSSMDSKTLFCMAEVADSNDKTRYSAHSELDFSSSEEVRYSTSVSDSKSISIPAAFVDSTLTPGSSAVEQVVINKTAPLLLDILRRMNPKIERIAASNQEVYVDIGSRRLMPLNTLGSGMTRLAKVCAMALSHKAQILLLDGIEKGMHYRGIENFLEAILKIAGAKDIQFFATTHSLDVLKGLRSLLRRDSFAILGADVKCFKLAKDKDGKVVAYRYDHDQFDHCIRHGIELR